MKRVLAVVLWVGCSVFDYAAILGDTTRRFPEAPNFSFALMFSLLGPIALPEALTTTGHYRLTPLTTEQRWQAFHRRYPDASYKEFDQTYN